MGEVADRLSTELREALKSGDRTRLATMRLLAAAVKNREVELGHDLTEEEFLEVVGREVKRRKEAAEAFERGDRPELMEKERAEQAILEAYLPEQLSEDEVGAIIEEAITATGASGPDQVGKVMGWIMARHRGRVDGGRVNALARERLAGGSP
ncbi:MAG: GatB/YqeY domain-containing protein [Actinomycetota bacterium]